MIVQLVTSQTHHFEDVGSVSGTFESSRVVQFMRLNPPMFTGSKVEEDPQGFIDELEKIF